MLRRLKTKESSSNKVTAWSSTPTDTNYPSEKLVKDSIDGIVNDTVASLRDEVTAILSRERVYVTIAVSSSGNIQDIANAQPTVIVRDRTNGDILWQHQVDCSQNGTDTISDSKIVLPYFDLNAKFDYEIYATHITIYNAGGQTLSADQYIDPARIHKTVAFGDVVTGERSMLTYQHVNDACDIIYMDDTINNPTQKITGNVGYKKVNGEWVTNTEGGGVARWIKENTHRYAMKFTGDTGSGASNNISAAICQLDDSDSTIFADGTDASTDISTVGVDVMVKFPTFYWKMEELSNGYDVDNDEVIHSHYWCLRLSKEYIDGFKAWNTNQLLGAYEAYSTNSKAYSVSGVESTGSISQANWKSYARARGYNTSSHEGFTIMKWKQHNIIAMLFFAIYGTTDSQSVYGIGASGYTKETGQTNILGMEDTRRYGNGDSGSVNFLGIENVSGNKGEWIDNVRVNYFTTGNVFYITEDDNTVREVVTRAGAFIYVWPTRLVFGEHFDLVASPDTTGGSDSNGYCDGIFLSQNASNVVFVSGNGNGTYGGVVYVHANNTDSRTDGSFAARLAFLGEVTEYNDTTAFKALPIL